jgi:hypothetical protein
MTVINDAPEDCQHKSLFWLTQLQKTFTWKIICISIEFKLCKIPCLFLEGYSWI